jgi:hypothetical protein
MTENPSQSCFSRICGDAVWMMRGVPGALKNDYQRRRHYFDRMKNMAGVDADTRRRCHHHGGAHHLEVRTLVLKVLEIDISSLTLLRRAD